MIYVLFLPLICKGDGNIRYYEITAEKPFLTYLMEFRSAAPQKGLGKNSVLDYKPPFLMAIRENVNISGHHMSSLKCTTLSSIIHRSEPRCLAPGYKVLSPALGAWLK